MTDDTTSDEQRDRAESTGDLVLAALTSPEQKATLARSNPWTFVYEGTIANGDALCAALDPGWVVSPGLRRRPGTVIFAHFITYLARVGLTLTANAAIARAVSDLRRARTLGSAAFLCSNGSNLYAYASGRALRVANALDAIVVATPESLSDARAAQDVPDDSLIAFQRTPQMGWAILSATT